jgi:hypothetical protein
MESCIKDLELVVRAPAERLAHVGPAARELALRVLQRSDELLEARAPGRILLLRSFPMQWRLLEQALSHEGEKEVFARQIADALEEKARVVQTPPSTDQEVVVFEDEPHWRAEYLASLSRGEQHAWFFEPLRAEGEPPGVLLFAENRALAQAVLRRLQSEGRLSGMLASLDAGSLGRLAAAVGTPRVDEAQPPASPASLPPELDAALERLPDDTPAQAAALCLFAAAQISLGSGASEAEVAAVAGRALAELITLGPGPTPEHGIDTLFGGLFYLLSPALELSLGESLWRACLPEGVVLARAAAALLGAGAANDPAPFLFGGVRPGDPFPDIVPEQQAEVSLSLFAALLAALPRRGLAALPEPFLRLAETPAGRLFVAADRASPFPFFAFPASSPEDTRAALDAFLAVWPASVPAPRATRALAELDHRARVRPLREPTPPGDLLLAEGPSLPARALVTQAAGTLGHLFAARAGLLSPFRPEDLVARHLAVPARVLLGAEKMEVRLPLDRLDLYVRRAGLDADPGWVPWLRRRVRFEFWEHDPGAQAASGVQ